MGGITEELRRSLSVETQELRDLADTLDLAVMERIVRLIGDDEGHVVVSGCGTSAMAGKKVVHSMNCIERPAMFLTPSDAVHGGLGVLKEKDIMIFISKGGNTEELVGMLPACKTKKATTIAVTENPDSILGRECDLCLQVRVKREPCRFNMLATASTLAVVLAFDAICIALMQYTNYTREQFAVIHPGGAVGKRLLGKEMK